jgi:hypothetical protein
LDAGDLVKLKKLIREFKKTLDDFSQKHGVHDILTNSKIFEIVIANELDHSLIPGHSGSKDAKNDLGEFEYKHFKESSSNHSWTFNDYTDSTITSLKKIQSVIFAHIDDQQFPPILDWYIEVDGETSCNYLDMRTKKLLKEKPKGKVNARKMINLSALQLERDLNLKKTNISSMNKNGKYTDELMDMQKISKQIEKITGISQILTSNKFYEMLVAIILGHQVLSEQSGHDAKDDLGNTYEYKVSKTHSWSFQDISEKVLKKYEKDEEIILAVVDKQNLVVTNIYSAVPQKVVTRLKQKLQEKEIRYARNGKKIRRKQAGLSKGDLIRVGAKKIDFT